MYREIEHNYSKLKRQMPPLQPGVDPKYHATAPMSRGEAALNRLWPKVREDILAEFPDDEVPVEVPKSLTKFTPYGEMIELMDKYPVKSKRFFEWAADTPLKLDGVRIERVLPQLAINQTSLGVADPKPAWTFHGRFIPFEEARRVLTEAINKEAKNFDPHILEKERDGMEDWSSVLGGKNPWFIFADLMALFHGRTYHQDSDTPIPWDIFVSAWYESMKENFPRVLENPGLYSPRHLFLSTASSGGILLSNNQGAAGSPYSFLDLEGKRLRSGRPKKQGRFTKLDVARSELQILVKWIKEGMPMTGDTYDLINLPATPTFRGDREVPLNLRKWAHKVPSLAALLPSRSIIIVPAVQTLAQMTYSQTIGEYVTGQAPKEFDWVDANHTKLAMESIRSIDISQSDVDEWPTYTVGADCSTWDRDVTGQEHCMQTLTMLHFFPERVRLLYVDSPAPLDVDQDWIDVMLSRLEVDEVIKTEVPIVGTDGSTRTQEVTVEVLEFDFHDFICKTMSMINSSSMAMGSMVCSTKPTKYYIPQVNTGHVTRGRFITANGGRRSGDAYTGYGNTDGNVQVIRAGMKMLSDPDSRDLVLRRLARQGITEKTLNVKIGSGKDVIRSSYLFARGDDLIGAFQVPPGTDPLQLVAAAYVAVGKRANPKKQESSGVPRHPQASFANIHLTSTYLGKLASRNWKRFMVQESPGVSMETLTAVQEENSSDEKDILVATTLTALARLAPLSGFPLMDQNPVIPHLTKFAVHNDEYRLAFITPNAENDGKLNLVAARDRLTEMISVMARAQARIMARKGGAPATTDMVEEFERSDIHNLIMQTALVPDYSPTHAVPRVDNKQRWIDGELDSV